MYDNLIFTAENNDFEQIQIYIEEDIILEEIPKEELEEESEETIIIIPLWD